jgi:hypothetical protein
MQELLKVFRETPSTPATAATAAVLGLVGLALLAWRRRLLTGTTLVAPWCWAAFSIVAISGSETLLGLTSPRGSPQWPSALQFAAAVTTFCPVMALLGAKRPQDRAWQLIVASLWFILSLPAFETALYQRSGLLDMHVARRGFLLVLVVVGVLNMLPTRFWPSALLYAVGQLFLLTKFVPSLGLSLGAGGAIAGLVCFVASAALVIVGLPRRHLASTQTEGLWLDFRDSFGSLWALRVAERINATAALNGWYITVGLRGFRSESESARAILIPSAVHHELQKNLRSMLRRFVSHEWIAARLGHDNPKTR